MGTKTISYGNDTESSGESIWITAQTDKYDTKQPSIEHTMDYLVEYLADEYAADIAQEKYSSDNSPLIELDEEKYKMDEYRRNVRIFFRYGLNRMIKERMGLSTGGFPDYDMSFIKDMPESDFCELPHA